MSFETDTSLPWTSSPSSHDSSSHISESFSDQSTRSFPSRAGPSSRPLVQHAGADLVVADPAADGIRPGRSARASFADSSPRSRSSSTPRSHPPASRRSCGWPSPASSTSSSAGSTTSPVRFLELLEGIPAYALGDQMLQELAGPLSGSAGHRGPGNRPALSVARRVQECSGSRCRRGDEPPHAVPESRAGRDLLGQGTGGLGAATSCLCVFAGPWTVDQGCGRQGRVSFPVATLAADARADRDRRPNRCETKSLDTRSLPCSLEQVRRRRRKQ